MDVGSITAAVQGAKFVSDTLRALAGLKIDTETLSRIHDALSKLSEVQSNLLESQQRLFEQQRQIDTLTREADRSAQWAARAASYALVQTPGGATVWQANDVHKHYACPVCFEKQFVSILQDRGVYAGTWDCKACNANYRVSPSRQAEPIRYR